MAFTKEPQEDIIIYDDNPIRKGEREGETNKKEKDMRTTCEPGSSKKKKRNEMSKESEINDEPRKTRGVCPNYCHLNDPFSDNDEDNDNEK